MQLARELNQLRQRVERLSSSESPALSPVTLAAHAGFTLVFMPLCGAPRIMKMMVSDTASIARNCFVIVAGTGLKVGV